ncbi:MAG: glycosyltransferase family 39 protein [Planctomycetia bacterium]|nr:glycosyltransferase family 39 protein [Planctomycetia bacterium]
MKKEAKGSGQESPLFSGQRTADFTNCQLQFWGAAIVIALYWLLLCVLVMKNYRLDVIEQYVVGREWVFGSSKHPSLTALLLEVFFRITLQWEIAPYLLARLCILITLWAIWRLAREYLSDSLALIAVFAMFSYSFFQYGCTEYNNNITLNMAWACAVFFIFKALHTNKLRWWILSGFCLGIGLHFKYTLIILPLMVVLFLILDPQGRPFWKKKGPWITILVAVLLFLPHGIWIYQNGFITLKYASSRIPSPGSWTAHIVYPLCFIGSQLVLILPTILPLVPLCGWIGKPDFSKAGRTFESRFLIWIVLAPFALQILLSAIKGAQIPTALGSHLWLFLSVLLLHVLKTDHTEKRIQQSKRSALILCLVLASLSMMIAWTGPYFTHRASRYQFPGRALAEEAERCWHKNHQEKLPAIVGPWWPAGNIAVYGKDRPPVYANALPDSFLDGPLLLPQRPHPEKINQTGGIVVWFIPRDAANDYSPPRLLERFPKAVLQKPVPLLYQTSAELRPLWVGLAVVDPPDPLPKNNLELRDPDRKIE